MCFGSIRKDLAATYSRGGYTTTTIGNAAFDGRVRDGNGSDHSFMATKKSYKEQPGEAGRPPENCIWRKEHEPIRELKSLFPLGKKAIKPHDRLVLVR